ncbi:MAG: peptidylprolyl isomerase [Paracoccaceae bacterium]
MRLAALTIACALALPVAAQSPFSPAVQIDGAAVTFYEIDQRARLLRAFNTPGDTEALAREQLIEDRLKMAEIQRAGMRLTDEALERELEAFAQNVDLSLDEFRAILSANAIEDEAFRDFVRVGVTWRDYIRRRYGDRADPTAAEIEREVDRTTRGGPAREVLLSEIIIPAPPPRATAALAVAERISQLRSTAAFEAEARRVSALPSRVDGGRLDWLPIENYPAGLRALLLDLAPGEVTDPIPITNGVALFQLRAVREGAVPPETPVAFDYATVAIPGGTSPEALAQAQLLRAQADRCDDLFGVLRDTPSALQRQTQAAGDVPTGIASVIAGLDEDEASWGLTTDDGSLLFVMLCDRQFEGAEQVDREAVASALRSQRLASFADALLADLRAEATIRDPA